MDKFAPRLEITVHPGAYLMLAATVLLLPLPWVVGWLLSSAFHELCHLGALRLAGISIHTLELGAGGARIRTAPMPPVCEALCALAGPLGALLLVGLGGIFPQLAICALVQSGYHLLPVSPLDGGRAFRCLSSAAGIPVRLCRIFEFLVLGLLVYLGFWLSFGLGLGFLTLGAALMLVLRCFLEKFLANRTDTGYNRATT